MIAGLPTGTVTFLFSDVEGSTRLLRELGNDYAGMLAEHRRVLREAFTRHGGVEVDVEGDAFFVAFPTAASALVAAADAHDALATTPVRVRIGVHTGQPELTGEGYVGIDVHRAARIAAAAHGGQTLVSRPTRELVSENTSLADLGEHRLKDLVEPEWLFQLGAGEFPPVRSISVTNLPTRSTSFVGRRRELVELASLLERPETRLVTLTGPGGVGKTSLAVEAARAVQDRYANGVFVVQLATVDAPSLVLPELARVLGVAEEGGRPLAESLADRLSARRALLLLDNLEHLLPGAALDIAGLLADAEGPAVVVTSRELLRIAGEVEYAVEPLTGKEAELLFLERAAAAGAPLEADEAVEELTTRLDGLPLALELAAARAKLLPPRQLLERLGQRLDVLHGARDAAERHRTLRATIEWSYDLLDAEERRLLAQLSVFAGSWTLEAAEQVCGADLELVGSLLDKSLLRSRQTGAEPRFWLLETIREFGAERLEELDDAVEVRRRHATRVLQLVEDGTPIERGEDPAPEWLARIEVELDDIRAAYAWLAAAGEDDLFTRLVAAGSDALPWLGAPSEARSWLEEALNHPAPAARRLALLMTLSWTAYILNDFDRQLEVGEEKLELARAIGDVRGEVDALDTIAVASAMLGDHERSAEALAQGLAEARAAGLTGNVLSMTVNLSGTSLARRDWERVIEYSDEAIALVDELESGEAAATIPLFNKAFALLELGRPEEARGYFQRSVRTCFEPPFYDVGIAYSISGLAAVAGALGDHRRAARLAGAADARRDEIGIHFDPVEQERHEQTLSEARAALGPDFEDVYTSGSALDQSAAIEEALE